MKVVYTPEAETHLVDLYRYVAQSASVETAERFTNALVDFCDSLSSAPLRGAPRDDIRKGMRVVIYRRRTVIAYHASSSEVSVLGVFYGGQDIETLLSEP